MNRTDIEWVLNPNGTPGFTWNPISGCLNHVNGICKGGGFPCYAYKVAHGRVINTYLGNHFIAPTDCNVMAAGLKDPFFPRYWEKRVEDVYARNWRKARGVFVCDMGDLFGKGIPTRWTNNILATVQTQNRGPLASRFYLLTKQPQNLPQWKYVPDNAWLGVTVCNDGMATEAYTGLSRVQAPIKYLSIEPLLGSISWKSHQLLNIIDWVIIGAQTKPTKYPREQWIRETVEACDKKGIPVFIKNNLRPLLRYPASDHSWAFRKEGGVYILRQEMPNVS